MGIGANQKPKLILNFDINKTIVYGDAVKGQSFESTIKALIAECSWGEIDKEKDEWVIKNNILYFEKPKEGLVSYQDYLGKKYKKKSETELPNKDERTKYNLEIKKKKIEFTDNFCSKGAPGEKMNEHYEKILEELRVPKDVLDSLKEGSSFKKLYEKGYYFIFLSLFITMIRLTRDERDFAIVFRSFGTDTDDVLVEFNEFCKGNHPLFDGKHFPQVHFDGTNGSKNYVVEKKNQGLFYRFGDQIEQTTLVMGVKERIDDPTVEKIGAALQSQVQKGEAVIINGGLKIYKYLKEEVFSGKCNSYVIGDYYKVWFENDEKTEFSKPMFINPYDFKVHQIFFDDNINFSPNSIVDCRNVVTGKTMEDKFIKDKYIVKVDSIQASVDYEYFYKQILQAEKLRSLDNEGGTEEKTDEELVENAKLAFKKENLDKSYLNTFIQNFVSVTK